MSKKEILERTERTVSPYVPPMEVKPFDPTKVPQNTRRAKMIAKRRIKATSEINKLNSKPSGSSIIEKLRKENHTVSIKTNKLKD